MKPISALISAILIPLYAGAQDIKTASLILPEEPLCPAGKAEYTARATCNGLDTAAQYYIWDMDNGAVLETAEPVLQYAYPEGGAYMARITAVFADGSRATEVRGIKVGQKPSFGNFRSNLNPRHNGICLGESAVLSLKVENMPVEYRCRDFYMEKNPQSIYNSYWLGTINLKNLPGGGDAVSGITLTASTVSEADIRISIQAPDGNEAVIKDYGEPMPEGRPADGKAKGMRDYDFGFQLICPNINGDWILRAESRGTENEAYILGYQLIINSDVTNAARWGYTQEYDMRRAVWSGKGVSATSAGVAKVTPQQDGNTRYTFMVTDDLGCIHDTTVYVSVERASFSGADSTTFIGDEIGFECNASWAAEASWSFGDKTPTAHGNPAPHAYYEKGKYMVVMQARSESGCVDIDTQFVSIVPRPLEVKEVNIFTPNGDGQNDVFTFFQEDESFLANGGLTKMPANIRSIKGKIYNVYGQTVYKWDEVEASVFGWDGTWHNKGSRHCPPGTYFYDIIVYGKDGNSLKRTGSILLVRGK